MRIAIVDDDKEMRSQLSEYIRRFATEQGSSLEAQSFSGGIELLENYKPQYDVIIFDVDMPDMNGIEAARLVRAQDEQVVIMFITNIAQYAINGYEVEAVDYVLKPVSYYDFSLKFLRALRRVRQREEDRLVLDTPGGPTQIETSKIQYVEVLDHYLIYHTKDTQLKVRGSFREHESTLRRYRFSRCHKSYMVNLAHVRNIRSAAVVLADVVVPLGRTYKEPLMEDYIRFLHG